MAELNNWATTRRPSRKKHSLFWASKETASTALKTPKVLEISCKAIFTGTEPKSFQVGGAKLVDAEIVASIWGAGY